MTSLRQITLPFGGETVTLRIPEDRITLLAKPEKRPANPFRLLSQALKHPVDSPPLGKFLRGGSKLTILVNDADRATPTAQILDAISSEITDFPGTITFMIATGTHGPLTSEQKRKILGHFDDSDRYKVICHDARDIKNHIRLGTTSRGTEVFLDTRVAGADRLIAIGSVEPHYFAGFTGGRKSIFPGAAVYASIEQNHKLAMEPAVGVLKLKGNPVHEDMVEACRMPEVPVFSIQTILDSKDRLFGAVAGNLDASFERAVAIAEEAFTLPVHQLSDMVIAAAEPPLDKNLYQAHKAIENTISIVKPGGILILIAACREGLGNDTFVRLLSQSNRPEDVIQSIQKSYTLGTHKAARIARHVMEKEIWLVSTLDPQVVRDIFMIPFPDAQSAVDRALSQFPDSFITLIPHADVMIPIIRVSPKNHIMIML